MPSCAVLLAILGIAGQPCAGLQCRFMCDDPVTDCVFMPDPPRCELTRCSMDDCGHLFETRVNQSTLNNTCPSVETLYKPAGMCTNCGALCEHPSGHWVCDVKTAPLCQAQCENPGDGCEATIVRSYLSNIEDDSVSGTFVYATIIGVFVTMMLAIMIYYALADPKRTKAAAANV